MRETQATSGISHDSAVKKWMDESGGRLGSEPECPSGDFRAKRSLQNGLQLTLGLE
jgi:hypothetical protein